MTHTVVKGINPSHFIAFAVAMTFVIMAMQNNADTQITSNDNGLNDLNLVVLVEWHYGGSFAE
jgi:hypothetical protein